MMTFCSFSFLFGNTMIKSTSLKTSLIWPEEGLYIQWLMANNILSQFSRSDAPVNIQIFFTTNQRIFNNICHSAKFQVLKQSSGLWFLRIFPDFRIFCKSPFASRCSWKKRSSHQGKKEVACIVSKPLVSCLWGCGESVNPPILNIQEF